MNPIADMVARLIAAGTPPELAAVVVAEAFAAGAVTRQSAEHPVDAATERRRAYDRDRQRKLRELRRVSADNPPMSQNALPSSSPHTQEIQKEGKKKERGGSLSADWQPSVGHFDEGAKLKLSSFEVEALADDMRLWAGANSNRAVARKSNWNLAFSAWMRREAGKRKPTNAKSGIIDAADRALENLRQSEREAAERGSGIGGEAPFRLISQG